MPISVLERSWCKVCRSLHSRPQHCVVGKKGFRLGTLACSISRCSHLLSRKHQ
uniref:Uncharacterized protein n=1 Tax=Arundo donax TaxID=35708 RepID=A0A0A9GC99_ARUDO